MSSILIQIKWNCCGLWMHANMKGDFTSIPNLCITLFERQKERGLTTEKMETPTPMKNMSRIVTAVETKRSIQPFNCRRDIRTSSSSKHTYTNVCTSSSYDPSISHHKGTR